MKLRLMVAVVVAACVSRTGLPQIADENELLDAAKEYRAKGKLSDCLSTLEAVIVRARLPKIKALARCRKAECYLEMSKPAEAEAELRAVLRDHPAALEEVNWARVALINALAFQGKHHEAIDVFKALREAHKAGQANDLQLAWACAHAAGELSNRNETAKALETLAWLDSIKTCDPGPLIQGTLLRAEILFKQKRYADAVQPLETILALDSSPYSKQLSWAAIRLSEALYQTQQYNKAVELSSAAAFRIGTDEAFASERAQLLQWKARALLALSDHQAASTAIGEALALKNLPAQVLYEVLFLAGETYRMWATREDAETLSSRHLFEQSVHFYARALATAQAAKLSEESCDLARLQVGTGLCHLGDIERGVALMRIGIQDPSHLAGVDTLLAERIRASLPADAALAWTQYLIDPTRLPDPTIVWMQNHFGLAPSAPSSPPTTLSFTPRLWLAQSYLAAEDLQAAIETLETSESAAKADADHARIHMWLMTCFQRLADQAPDEDQAKTAQERALAEADTSVSYWTQIARCGTDAEAHFAMEQAIACYEACGKSEEALALSDAFVAAFDPTAHPSKHAFALFQRMQVAARRSAPALELANLAEGIYEQHKANAQADVRDICGLSMLWAAYFYAESGSRERALAILEHIEANWGNRFTKNIKQYRETWQTATK